MVPFPPGGSNDIIARALVGKLSEDLRHSVVVDNRGGANGIIGTDLTAKSPPDGHTFLIVGNGFAINPSMYRKLPYHPERDFAAVSLVGYGGFVLVVHPSLAARNVNDLIALAKASPGKLTMASAGVGNMAHLSGELFMSLTGTRFVHVPYKGGGPAMTELLGGQVALYFSTIIVALPHIRAGKLRALAVTTARPSVLAPGLPAMAETLPGYESAQTTGLFAPARTPASIISRLNEECVKFLSRADIKEKLLGAGVESVGSSPREFDIVVKSEISRMGKVIKSAGIRED